MKASIAERLSHYGAWAPMVLFSWVNIHNVYLPAGLEFINTYLGFSVVMLAVVAACLFGLLPRDGEADTGPRGAGGAGAPVGRTIACTLDWAACAGMAVGCVLVVAPCLFGVGPHLALAGSVAAGLGIGWSYVRWALCLAHFGLRDLIRIVFVGCIVWTAARTGLNVLPLPASTAVAATVPLLSGIMLRLVLRCTDAAPARSAADPPPLEGDAPARGARLYRHHGGFSTWHLWVVIVTLSLNNQLLVGGTSPYLGNLDGVVYPVKALCSALLMGLVLVWTLRTSLPFDFVLLWRGLYILAAVALLIVALVPQGAVLWIASCIATDLLIPILWLTVCTVARHTNIPSYLVIGTGLGAYGVASFVGLALGKTVPAPGLATLCTALLFILFIVLALCLDSRNPDLLQLFDDLRGKQVRTADLAQINARCAAVGAKRRLTPREIEVMQMLCAGRSRSYVAETLYISENTVKTHTDRLYKKLGVHSREELQELVGL